MQDTFLVAAEKMSAFNGESSTKTWLFSILNHKIIDFYRKKSSSPIMLENDNAASYFDADEDWKTEKMPKDWHDEDEINLLDNEDFNQVLQKCLDALPEKWSVCIKLKYLSEKNGEDICQELGITTSNFWQIVHRAKLQLRNCIENNWFNN